MREPQRYLQVVVSQRAVGFLLGRCFDRARVARCSPIFQKSTGLGFDFYFTIILALFSRITGLLCVMSHKYRLFYSSLGCVTNQEGSKLPYSNFGDLAQITS